MYKSLFLIFISYKKNILIISLIVIIAVTLLGLINHISSFIQESAPYLFFFILFSLLLTISAFKSIHLLMRIFIAVAYLGILYLSFVDGSLSVLSILLYIFLIIISGILTDGTFTLLLTITESIGIIFLSYLEQSSIHIPRYIWNYSSSKLDIAIFITITFLLISILSWLNHKELKTALQKLQKSELLLKREKKLLEKKVIERTKELREAEIEKMSQIYKFAEIGRVSAGLFHDLVNPLSLISLNLDQLREYSSQNAVTGIKTKLHRAILGTKKIESFILSFRKQLHQDQIHTKFSLVKEIEVSIEMIQDIARERNIHLSFENSHNVFGIGNPIKFNQVVSNIIRNAIEAYDEKKIYKRKEVLVTLSSSKNMARLKITDWADGVSQDSKQKIFEPFFTTKSTQSNTGIGLYMCKEIVTKNFHGSINLKTKRNEGTTFFITFSLKPQR